jgi:Mor family transcriptional regulator
MSTCTCRDRAYPVTDIAGLPAEYRPPIGELPGDMRVIAGALEEDFPGLGVLITLSLAQRLGGGWTYIRRLNNPLIDWRNDQIRAMYDQGGVTVRELARIWRLSQSSIEKILARPSKRAARPDRQMRLF